MIDNKKYPKIPYLPNDNTFHVKPQTPILNENSNITETRDSSHDYSFEIGH